MVVVAGFAVLLYVAEQNLEIDLRVLAGGMDTPPTVAVTGEKGCL